MSVSNAFIVRREYFSSGRYSSNKSLLILERPIAYNIGISGGCISKCPSLNRGTGGGWVGGDCSPSVEMKFCEYFAKTKCKILQSTVINWKFNRQNILI